MGSIEWADDTDSGDLEEGKHLDSEDDATGRYDTCTEAGNSRLAVIATLYIYVRRVSFIS